MQPILLIVLRRTEIFCVFMPFRLHSNSHADAAPGKPLHKRAELLQFTPFRLLRPPLLRSAKSNLSTKPCEQLKIGLCDSAMGNVSDQKNTLRAQILSFFQNRKGIEQSLRRMSFRPHTA